MGVMGLADGTDLAREGKEGYLPGVCGSRWEDRELSPGRWLQNAAGLGVPRVLKGKWSGASPCGQVGKWGGGWTCGSGLWGAFRLDFSMDGRP